MSLQDEHAKIIPIQDPDTTPDSQEPDQRHVPTMIINRGGKRYAWIFVLIGILLVLGVVAYLGYRFTGGEDGPAAEPSAPTVVQPSVAPLAPVSTETPAVTIDPSWKDSCKGDPNLMSDQRQYYCQVTMPTMQKLSDSNARLAAKLKENSATALPWILFSVLAANSLVCWILLIRRRKASA